MIFLGDFSFVRIFLKNYRVTITTTLDTSCSENIMVLSARRGFLHAWYFLVIIIIIIIWATTKKRNNWSERINKLNKRTYDKSDPKTQQLLNSTDFQKFTKIIILSDQLFLYLDPPPTTCQNTSLISSNLW